MSLPFCPDPLPGDLGALIQAFGELWATSSLRPTPEKRVVQGWQKLLETWAVSADLPLLVRKHRGDRGHERIHASGRTVIPTDNSAAHWAFTLACEGRVPSIEDIRAWLAQDAIPMVMIQKSIEKQGAKFHCTLRKEHDVNRRGWKLGHIRPVGLNTRTLITEVPLQRLQEQYIALLSPMNMFVIPLAWSGLAEIQSVVQAIAVRDAFASGNATR